MKAVHWVVLVILIFVCILIGIWALIPKSAPSWTGFSSYDVALQSTVYKTLWDWLELIIIPVVLACSAWLFSTVDKDAGVKIETDRQRQNLLSTFIETFSDLLLKESLRSSKPSGEVRWIARSFALSIFRQLDPNRKAEALQFLYEAGLINQNPITNITGADLTHIDLSNAYLVGADITGVYFQYACLQNANLRNASLCGSNFSKADFRGANLENVDLSYARLSGANLLNCDLTKTNLQGAIITGARIKKGSLLPEQLKDVAS